MSVLKGYEPASVLRYFEEICSIPHGSGNMEQISDYCVAFAKEHNLKYRKDENCNVIIWKEASAGYENAPAIILQGHMDMVAVKDADCSIDLEKDGLELAVDEGMLYAKGTSLGGDDGIAVAYALAVLASDDIPHPALEAVFTVDEEIGLLGASALDTGDLQGKILLNMDSEDDGIFLISCAGGATVECHIPAPEETAAGAVYRWSAAGLQGGHSGAEIHKGRANANVVLGRYLLEMETMPALRIGAVRGGEKDNAIANSCQAVVVVPASLAEELEQKTALFAEMIKKEYALTEPAFSLTLEREDCAQAQVLTEKSQNALANLLIHLPAGMQKMMADMPQMVQTSLNLGILERKDNAVILTYSVRSSVESERDALIKKLQHLTKSNGGHCEVYGMYPAWEYQPNSKIRDVMAAAYEDLFGEKPVLEAIHAGVECGILSHKIPGLDCVSYGPQMHDIHTTRERLDLSSVKKNWELTVEVLQRMR